MVVAGTRRCQLTKANQWKNFIPTFLVSMAAMVFPSNAMCRLLNTSLFQTLEIDRARRGHSSGGGAVTVASLQFKVRYA